MRYTPRAIIFTAVSRYLSPEKMEEIKEELIKKNVKQDRAFLSVIKRHFDFNLMKDKPALWQDIWIYNYLEYEVKNNKLKPKGLIAKYEQEIVIPSGEVYKLFIEIM
jgi:hypothetical protein